MNILDQYNYAFPQELIAQEPAQPRDSARLLIYEKTTDTTTLSQFKDIGNFLPPNSVLVCNNSKVIPARLFGKKTNGSNVVALGKKLQLHEIVTIANTISFTVVKKEDRVTYLKPNFPITDIFQVLEKHGHVPLPPYIKQSPLTEDQKKSEYQTVFAQVPGSVAAPTASLHFTPELLEQLPQKLFLLKNFPIISQCIRSRW